MSQLLIKRTAGMPLKILVIPFLYGIVETLLFAGVIFSLGNNEIGASISNFLNVENSQINKLKFVSITIIFLLCARIFYTKWITKKISFFQAYLEKTLLHNYLVDIRGNNIRNASELTKLIMTDVTDYVFMFLQPMVAISLALGAVLPFVAYIMIDKFIYLILIFVFFAIVAILYKNYVHKVTVELGEIIRSCKEDKTHIINDISNNYRTIFFYGFNTEYLQNFGILAETQAKSYATLTYISNLIKPSLEFVVLSGLVIFLYGSVNHNWTDLDLAILVGSIFRIMPAGYSILTNISYLGYSTNARNQVVDGMFGKTSSRVAKLQDSHDKKSFRLPQEFYIQNITSKCVKQSTIKQFLATTFKSSKFYAILGESGTGKSTVINALAGFCQNINIEIYDVDISKTVFLENGIYPSNVGYVPQEAAITSGTILENIYLDRKLDEEMLNKVLTTCLLQDVAKRLKATKINRTITLLSGGEIQRLAIARSLYSAPDFLIFDEALSALPIETQKTLLNNIKIEFPQVGIISIMHNDELLDQFSEIIRV